MDLIIYGSPNKNSFTMELLKKTQGESFNNSYFFDCFANSTIPCDGCGFCKTANSCKHSDLEEFFNNFKKANNVIIAFPVYNGSFPAPLKALIDRFQQFYNARFFKGIKPPIQGKRNVTLIITAGSSTNPLYLITEQIKPVFTVCGCKLEKAIMLLDTDNQNKDNIITVNF